MHYTKVSLVLILKILGLIDIFSVKLIKRRANESVQLMKALNVLLNKEKNTVGVEVQKY